MTTIRANLDLDAPAIENGGEWPKCPTCHRYIGQRRCQYCGKRYRTPHGLEAHERVCYRNPKRECPTCGGTGKVLILSGDLGCHDCAEAKRRQAGLDDKEDEWI